LFSCYDWCGYQYKKTGGFGSCTTKPDGAACGATSGRKQETYKCVDYETNNGDKCSGSAPVSYVDCEKTACPPPSCSSGKCVGRTGIYCDNVVVTGTSDVSITNQGCRATISSNVQGCCDCGGCSGSSTSSGTGTGSTSTRASGSTGTGSTSTGTGSTSTGTGSTSTGTGSNRTVATIKCDSQSACGRACCGEANPKCTNAGALAFITANGVNFCSLNGVDCSRCEESVVSAVKESVVSAQMPIKCDSQSACGRACCGEANPTCINAGVLAFITANGVNSCRLKGVDCSRCEKQVPNVNVPNVNVGQNANRASSASFVEPAAGLVTAGFVITLWLSVYKD
jgi:hypothetical protein